MAIARINHLTYWYPRSETPALEDVDLNIDEGITVVVGPSGGGKSTLLRVLNGLVPHFHGGRIKGDAHVAGQNIIHTPTRELARTVGFVFQDPELQAVYDTVEHEVAFGLENIGVSPRNMRARIEEALRDAGAAHLIGRKISTLSGGERQRVALASSLAMRPTMVVLDEPTSQLDPEGAALVLAAATRLQEQGRTVVISEHRLERLIPLAQQLITVERGRTTTTKPHPWTSPATPGPPRATTPGAEAWSLTKVTAGFGDQPILDQVSLSGRHGQVVALAGPNGGGKTTLLRLISGLLPPLAGHVDRTVHGRIAYLPQNPTALLHRPTVRSEVELTLNRAQEDDPPEDILQELGLMHVQGRYPRDLSCGERQRAALAAVLPGRPDIVLLDEPTRGMDEAARSALIKAVARLRDQGSAIVLATHDARLRDALADRVVEVNHTMLTEKQSDKVASR